MKTKTIIKPNLEKIAVSLFAVLLIAFFVFPFSHFEWNAANAEGTSKEITTVNGLLCVADDVIIKFKDSTAKEKKDKFLEETDPGYKTLSAKNTVKIKKPKDKDLKGYLDELNQNSEIEYAQPNFIYELEVTINDPYAQPGANQSTQWFHDRINTFEAWDYAMGEGVTVAVLDTGALVSHEDLGANITLMPDIATTDDPSQPADDDDGHGTIVTGIIGATANNSLGGSGIAPAANILVYDVFDYLYDAERGWIIVSSTDVLINGINAAVAAGADVINLSQGRYHDPSSTAYWDKLEKDTVDAAVASGVVVVCSAGNGGTSAYHVPSDYDSAIAVISTDYNDVISSFSDYGPLKDISAPGEGVPGDPSYGGILSTYFNGSYVYAAGTSISSPIVAGVCALLLSENPALTVDDIKNILYLTSMDLGTAGKDDYYGWGRVDALAAVMRAYSVYKTELDHETLEVEVGRTGTLTAAIYPESATNKSIIWSSDNETVATVAGGVITGHSVGTATITATTEDGSYTDTCEITVVPVAVTGVTLNKDTSEIIIGESDTLTATVAPEDASNKNITWSSDNEAVATVEGGVIYSVSVGTATITVTTEDGAYTDTCDVSVIPIPAEGVTLNKSTTSLYAGASEILKATITPDTAANKNVSWSSSNESIVRVTQEGMITAVAAGSATITATTESGGHTDTCAVTVSNISPVTIDDTIKVKLSIGSPTYIHFYIDGNYSVLGGSGAALERQQYRIEVDGSLLRLYYGTSSTPIFSGSTITLTQHQATSGNNFVWIDNYAYGPIGYLGDIVFSVSGGAIQAVNHVYLEEYLYGVVPNEMSDSWPAEALKAQAIAARSYAASSMGGGSYDVLDTSASQVYKGYDDGDVNTISAVNATQKKVLQYGNTIKKTYFAASNGGYTDSPWHVWPGGDNMPYAIYEDPYDVANSSSPYEKIFFPVAIDGSHPITTSDNVDGTPNIANAVAYIKSRILASGQLSGYGVTGVNDFELTGVLELTPHTYDTDDGENHSLDLPDGTNDCVDFVRATGRFNVSVGAGSYEVSNIVLDLHYFDASNGITTYKVFNMSSLRLFVIEGDETGWSIYQRRYGHGVGMSQRGAQQRANSGHTYDEIIAFYYPYASLMDLSYAKDALTSKVPVDNSNAVVVCNDYLNVRSGPSTSYSIVGTLPAGARIEVKAVGTWHTINFGGVDCYVHSDYVTLDGYVAVTGVTLDESSITLEKGTTQTLVATIAPANATNKNVTWSTSNASVATVSSSGLVTAVGGGTATITVTTQDSGRTDTCEVTVNVSVTGVTLDASSIVVYMGKTRTLTATVAPSDATNKSVTWSSDDESVATVEGGVITPVSEGTATIIVTTADGGHTDTCNVTVGTTPTDAIYSSVYTVDQTDSLLLGVPDEMTIADMVANLDNAASDIVVFGLDNMEISDWSSLVGTGMKVQLVTGETVADELDIVVLGDVNGDGIIDILDYSYVKLHIFDVLSLTGNLFIAGDVDKSGEIDIIDYSYIKLDIFDVSHIN